MNNRNLLKNISKNGITVISEIDITSIKALQQEKSIFIAHIEQKKIREYNSTEDDNNLIDLIKKWKIYSGIANEMNFTEFIIILDFIKQNFGDLNYEDINSAINLSTAQKLEFYKYKGDESFGNFSCTYVGRILAAYKEYKPNVIFKIKDQIEKKQLQESSIKINPDDRIHNFETLIIMVFQEIRKTATFSNDWNSTIFNYLHKNNYITITDQLILDSKIYAKENLIKKTVIKPKEGISAAILSLNKNDNKKPINKLDQENRTIELQKNYCVICFFQKLKKIDKFINEITIEKLDK